MRKRFLTTLYSVARSLRTTTTNTVDRVTLSRGFSSKTAFRGPLSFSSLILTLATGAGCLYFYEQLKRKKMQEMIDSQTKSVGAAAIGGPFTLTDQNGKTFTSDTLKTEFSILYFGFTHCPDICPDELDKIAEAVKSIKEEIRVRVQSVFITLDPERDHPKLIKSYIEEFDKEMIGLTGSRDAINKAAKAYRVYHSKANEFGNDYLIDHSIITYLLDPEGEFLTFYGKNFEASELAKSIIGHIKNWAEQHEEYREKHPTLIPK